MNTCKVEMDKQSHAWKATVYGPDGTSVVTSSPPLPSKDEAISFAQANFGHLADVSKLKS